MKPTELELASWRKFHELFANAFIHEALGAVAELKVADRVKIDTPVKELAKELGLHEGSLYRALRALSAYGIFEEVKPGNFSHTPFSELLKSDHPYSLHGMALLWHAEPMRKAWGDFAKSIKDGKAAFLHANGANVYQYLAEHPDLAQVFHRGMENNSAILASAIAEGFPFGDYKSVIDLGGGLGTLISTILESHPITGAVYDLPVVEASANAHFKQKGLEKRAAFLKGDWFASVPTGFDLYLVKNSLWNWTDSQCSQILNNISKAMGESARFMIIEYFPEPHLNPWSTSFDLQQLNITGGRGRKVEEYKTLLKSHNLKISASFSIENQQVLLCQRQ